LFRVGLKSLRQREGYFGAATRRWTRGGEKSSSIPAAEKEGKTEGRLAILANRGGDAHEAKLEKTWDHRECREFRLGQKPPDWRIKKTRIYEGATLSGALERFGLSPLKRNSKKTPKNQDQKLLTKLKRHF